MICLAKEMDYTLLEITKHLPMRSIDKNDGPYLERYYVGQDRRGEQTWLHRFLSADEDQFLHSHPWFADSTIICGGYTEESARIDRLKRKVTERFSVGNKNIINPCTLHRIIRVDKYTWTVLQVQPGRRRWYFIDGEGRVNDMSGGEGEDWWLNHKPRGVV